MTDEPLSWVLLGLAGVGSGFINTMAGGGSLLTLPALMLVGLPPDMANGSNRVSVVAQSLSGVVGFHREGKLDKSALGAVLAPTLLGSALGAFAASRAPNEILRPVLLTTMVVVAVLMALRPGGPHDEEDSARAPSKGATLGLFAAGLYGGFIQAGVGFVLLTVFHTMMRYDILRANALKLVCTLIFGVVALTIFVAAGQVVWIPAVVLAVGTVVGSLLGVRFALRVPRSVIRGVVLVGVLASVVAILLKGS
jgi:hypothetical protein